MPGLGILSEELLPFLCGSRQGVGSIEFRIAVVRTLRRHLVTNRSRYDAWIDVQANLSFAGYLEDDVFVDQT